MNQESDLKGITFSLMRDDSGTARGFTLSCGDGGNDYSKAFCLSFLKAYTLNKGMILFDGSEIVFIHKGLKEEEAEPCYGEYGFHAGDAFTTLIEPEDKKVLEKILSRSEEYSKNPIRLSPLRARDKGFALYV